MIFYYLNIKKRFRNRKVLAENQKNLFISELNKFPKCLIAEKKSLNNALYFGNTKMFQISFKNVFRKGN